MPSTPRMIEIERKASQPEEALSREEVAEWHRSNAKIGVEWFHSRVYGQDCWAGVNQAGLVFTPPDYPASIRYLDSPGWKARHNG